MAKKKKTTVNAFKKMTSDDIAKLTRKQAQALLRDMRAAYTKRAEILEKHIEKSKNMSGRVKEGNFYSPAYEAAGHYRTNKNTGKKSYVTGGMKDWYETHDIKNPSMTKIADAKAELSRLNRFFNSESSTVKGTNELSKRQDMRIFGASESDPSKPAARMTRSEREAFWAAYNEFRVGADTSAIFQRFKYGEPQIELGKIVLQTRKGGNMEGQLNITALIEALKAQVKKDSSEFYELGELEGNGDDFTGSTY